jgi:hypothetical protein
MYTITEGSRCGQISELAYYGRQYYHSVRRVLQSGWDASSIVPKVIPDSPTRSKTTSCQQWLEIEEMLVERRNTDTGHHRV